MSTTANYASTPRCGAAQVSAANTNLDGSGTVVMILTAGSSGSRIDRIDIKAVVTTSAGMIRLFVHDGTNYRLWKEVPVSAVEKSASVPAFGTTIDMSHQPLVLPSGYSLRAATEKAEAFNIIATGGDF